MVGADVYCVEEDPVFAESSDENGVNRQDVPLGRQPAPDRTLIADDHEGRTDRLSGDGSTEDEVEWLKIVRPEDVTVDDAPIQDPVAIEKQSRSRGRTEVTADVTEH
jgi:hypothetical protein